MRVLYVLDSLAAGGAETSLVHMAPGYRDLGIDLHIAYMKSQTDLAPALATAGATLHPVALDATRGDRLRALVRLIRRLQPDVVHTTLYESDVLGRVAAAATRTPSVTTFANSSYSSDHYSDPSLRSWKLAAAQLTDASTARLARGYQAVSPTVADDMARRLFLPRARIDVISRARQREMLGEPSAERRSRVRRQLELADDVPVVLAAARQEHQKGLDVLVDAVPSLVRAVPGVQVLVAGRDGRETARLVASIEDLGVAGSVRLLGSRDDVPDLIVASDVVVVPSRFEGMPGLVLEAMALDTLVVASDIPMVRDAIGAHAYALVPVGNAAALADALVRSMSDPDAASVAARARERFEDEFTPQAVVARLASLYETVMR